MKQYEYKITDKKTGRKDSVFATARNEAIARRSVVSAYSYQFDVSESPVAEYSAHRVYGEIDCSSIKE